MTTDEFSLLIESRTCYKVIHYFWDWNKKPVLITWIKTLNKINKSIIVLCGMNSYFLSALDQSEIKKVNRSVKNKF